MKNPLLYTRKSGLILILILTHFIFDIKSASAQNWQWAKSTKADINKIAHDASGNSYVTGSFTDTVVFGNTTLISSGDGDIFVAKYNASGIVQWAIKAGSTLYDVGRGIGIDAAGNVYVAGYFSDDILNGNTAACLFYNTIVSSAGQTDIFLAKYDSSGALIWVRHAGGQAGDYCDALSVDNAGNCYLTGSFGYDFYNGFGGVTALFNTIAITPIGEEDVYVAAYNSSGLLLWTEQAGGSQVRAFCIADDGSGNVIVSGVSFGGAEFETHYISSGYFIAKCSSLGWQWANGCESSSGWGVGNSLCFDSIGNTYVVGEFEDDAILGTDTFIVASGYGPFVAKYDVTGSILWAKLLDQNASASVISPALNGNVVYAGNFTDTLILGIDTLISNGQSDIFISTIDSSGNSVWSDRVGGNNQDDCIDLTMDNSGDIYLSGSYTDSTLIGTIALNDTSQYFYIAKYERLINVGNPELVPQLIFVNVFPNPVSQYLNISFTLLKSEKVTIKIYNSAGRLVKTLPNNIYNTGENHITWNALNENGNLVASGIYLLRLETSNYSVTKNISVIK